MSVQSAQSGRVTAHRLLEERYVALRHEGVSAPHAAQQLGLTDTGGQTFESHYRAQVGIGSFDSSCPRFAHNDHHVAAVRAVGGFPRAVATEYRGRLVAVWVRPDGQVWRPSA